MDLHGFFDFLLSHWDKAKQYLFSPYFLIGLIAVFFFTRWIYIDRASELEKRLKIYHVDIDKYNDLKNRLINCEDCKESLKEQRYQKDAWDTLKGKTHIYIGIADELKNQKKRLFERMKSHIVEFGENVRILDDIAPTDEVSEYHAKIRELMLDCNAYILVLGESLPCDISDMSRFEIQYESAFFSSVNTFLIVPSTFKVPSRAGEIERNRSIERLVSIQKAQKRFAVSTHFYQYDAFDDGPDWDVLQSFKTVIDLARAPVGSLLTENRTAQTSVSKISGKQ
jgi:hypothetical protein